MPEIYQNLFLIICVGILIWGVIRIERIYQYPFFMINIFISFLMPQVYALINNPGVVTHEALERVLLYLCLCAGACWIGYQIKPNRKWLAKLNIVIDERKLTTAGIALMIQGHFFYFILSRTTPDIAANGNWTGPATIYLFLAQVVNIAFGIFILQTLKRLSILNITCAILSGLPIYQEIMNGRRQPTMTFVIIIGLSLWMARRYIPPRWLVVTALLSTTFIIPVVGQLRSGFWELVFSGNWQAVQLATQQAFAAQLSGLVLELRNAALLADVVERTGLYGFGTGYWDNLVFQYVPGQIVGFDFKKSLQFNLTEKYIESLMTFYSYTIPNGTTYTGIGDSFTQFGYFGCVIFGFLAYIFKNIWVSAVNFKSTISRLIYIGIVSPAMIAVTHGIGAFLQQASFQVIFIVFVAYYSKVKYQIEYK